MTSLSDVSREHFCAFKGEETDFTRWAICSDKDKLELLEDELSEPMATMACFEVILWAAYQTGQLTAERIKDMKITTSDKAW